MSPDWRVERGMQRLWFVSNIASGSATPEKCAAIEAVLADRDLELVGRTRFPEEPLPDAAMLAQARADTVLLFAGDGTINAALCKLARWDGAVLILPGGTMNLLAKVLHPSLDPHAIIAAAQASARRIALPYVEAGKHRAFVGVILGPATSWVHAREAARRWSLGAALGAVRSAWQRSFGTGIRLDGAPGLRRRYQAVLVTPRGDDLAVAAIDARDWRAIADLGWSFLTGDWMRARAVATTAARTVRIPRGRPAQALFDGEPETLPAGTLLNTGRTPEQFLSTMAG